MHRQDEQGFTLVEMLIAMGMFSLVMMAILTFMTSGSRSYGYANGELNMQMESQMLINQVRDMVYDSNYAEYQDTGSEKVLLLYKVEVQKKLGASAAPSAAPESLRVKDPMTGKVTMNIGTDQILKKRAIYWKGDKLYYQEVDKDAPPTYPTDQENVICSFVKSFDASVKKKTGEIQFNVKLKNGSHNKYNLSEGMSMRSGWVNLKHDAGAYY